MWSPPAEHPIRRLFAGLTEHTFVGSLGIADPPLLDYVSTLLARFVHVDEIYRLRNVQGVPLEQVADMVMEAEGLPPEGRTRREFYRHIGDFALFWTGVYPEMLAKLRSAMCKDYFIDYCQQGKRSYYIAGTCSVDERSRVESEVLLRLSEQFELVAYGLRQVRQEWESLPLPEGPTLIR